MTTAYWKQGPDAPGLRTGAPKGSVMSLVRHAPAAAACVAVLAGSLLLAPGAAAVGAAPDPSGCAALQRDVDAYRRGEVQYFVDPTPAWRAAAEENGCTICGL
ncbi:hypothetical protein [Streptomyces sp. NPDC051561]|uniref:hypothetical protein n=1 Tax=Streptomyces sp. NPDC051561 TaxID=3365658 RepID=UPI0037AB9DE6